MPHSSNNNTLTLQTDFDHTSFAVHEALSHASRLREVSGASPIIGETLDAFRYLMMYIGSEEHGTKVEFIEPMRDGFLLSYLEKRGQSPHHLTFSVRNLKEAVAAVREQGFGVVDENYQHAAWQEAFIRPDATHRTIIQLASSDRQYPSAQQLLTTTERDAHTMPHIPEAKNRDWWTGIWDTPPGATTLLGPTVLQTTDMEQSHVLFGSILQGQARDSQVSDGTIYTWPGGAIELVPSETAGIVGIRAHDSTAKLVDFETILADRPSA